MANSAALSTPAAIKFRREIIVALLCCRWEQSRMRYAPDRPIVTSADADHAEVNVAAPRAAFRSAGQERSRAAPRPSRLESRPGGGASREPSPLADSAGCGRIRARAR